MPDQLCPSLFTPPCLADSTAVPVQSCVPLSVARRRHRSVPCTRPELVRDCRGAPDTARFPTAFLAMPVASSVRYFMTVPASSYCHTLFPHPRRWRPARFVFAGGLRVGRSSLLHDSRFTVGAIPESSHSIMYGLDGSVFWPFSVLSRVPLLRGFDAASRVAVFDNVRLVGVSFPQTTRAAITVLSSDLSSLLFAADRLWAAASTVTGDWARRRGLW